MDTRSLNDKILTNLEDLADKNGGCFSIGKTNRGWYVFLDRYQGAGSTLEEAALGVVDNIKKYGK